MKLEQRIEGGLIGLLVGDALGVPYEFKPPTELPSMEQIEFDPPQGFRRAHFGVRPGTWSDDGAQALILLDSLLTQDRLDLAHFSLGLRRWMLEGFYAVNRSVFDIGGQTSTAINRLNGGMDPEHSGPTDERHNGNGALMRVLPLVLWHPGPDAELVQLAMQQSRPTHGHLRSQLASAVYCLWAKSVLNAAASPWSDAVTRARELLANPDFTQELDLILDSGNAERVSGSGYVVDTLWSAKQAVEQTCDYESCVRHAISLGYDTDTTACVAGGIAGLMYGAEGIPARWRNNLRGMELVEPLLGKLLEHRAATE